ncbi:APC family permease [Ornithinimicrobium sp. Arc0846-15]|nr:APC family permease [Ornithinimicrobium laminariae]
MLQRTLTQRDATAIGLGSMMGAGLFVVWGPAAALAGNWLMLSLLLAAFVAVCNALSSAALAIRYPQAGGTYVYGRNQLGEYPGYLAGWCFVIGKTASCAAMAMTIGAAVWPGSARLLGVVAVVVVLGLNLAGVKRSARYSEFVVVCVLVAFLAVALGSLWSDGMALTELNAPATVQPSVLGVFGAAGFLFFAFAGYARIATLGEEVKDPRRTIPRAIGWALGLVTIVYAVVSGVLLSVLGVDAVAASSAPLVDLGRVLSGSLGGQVVAVVAVLTATGALVNLMLGVSRTSLAMARDGYGPATLTRTNAAGVPWVAESVVAAVVVGIVLTLDLRAAIGFSSFGVLLYYAVANAAALTLTDTHRATRLVAVFGFVGCVLLVATLPISATASGLVVVLIGSAVFVLRRGIARMTNA